MTEREQKPETERPKTSKLAIACLATSLGVPFAGILLFGLSPLDIGPLMKWALYLGVELWVFDFFRLIVLALWQAVPVLGAVALIKVGKRPTRLRGGGLAKAGLCIWVTINIIWILLRVLNVVQVGTIHRNVGKVATVRSKVVCSSHLRSLINAVVAYANDQEPPSFPVGDKWCDLLVEHSCTTWQFICPGSDAVDGESSYAMNKYVAGKDMSKLPPDVVVLFETNFGKDPRGRQGALKDRQFYNKSITLRKPETKVYKLRWNQVGGPELLTTENHEGEGCNVAFVSTRAEFVKTKDLGKLKWKPDEEE